MGKIMKQEKEELTGLYTADTAKMMIEEYLEKEQENVGMIVLDLDGFEQVNTMFDREKGDELLLDTSYILQQSFSEEDIIYRSKEDEFVIFLKHCQENTNLNIRLYELCTTLEREITDGLNTCIVTASIGVATSKCCKSSVDDLYACARQAMQEVKTTGKDDVKFYYPKMETAMNYLVQKVNKPLHVAVEVPGSKSITNRALLIGAMADGLSEIQGILFSDDSRFF